MDKGDKFPPDVRAEVVEWVGRSSLSYVAGVIGISRSAVHDLCRGSNPQRRTRDKVLAWYAKRSDPPASPAPVRARAPAAGHAGVDEARETVRELVRQRVERTSLRALETELGINRSTIHKFLSGGIPHARLWRVYRAWYDHNAGELVADVAYRDIPMEDLRRFFRRIVDEDSVRIVAEAAGIVRNTVAKFVNGANPDPQTIRLLGLYYLHEKEHGSGKRDAVRQARKRAGNKVRQKRPRVEPAG